MAETWHWWLSFFFSFSWLRTFIWADWGVTTHRWLHKHLTRCAWGGCPTTTFILTGVGPKLTDLRGANRRPVVGDENLGRFTFREQGQSRGCCWNRCLRFVVADGLKRWNVPNWFRLYLGKYPSFRHITNLFSWQHYFGDLGSFRACKGRSTSFTINS